MILCDQYWNHRTLAIYQDICASAIGSEKDGLAVHLLFVGAWPSNADFKKLMLLIFALATSDTPWSPPKFDPNTYRVGDALCEPHELDFSLAVCPFREKCIDQS